MGCKTSKEPHVDDDHFRRRRARAKHLALAVCDLDEHPQQSLKLAPRGPIIADGTASRTPAVTPQAEEGRCSEPRRASGAKGTRRPAHGDSSNSDHQQTEEEQVSPGVSSSRARRGSPRRKASTESSCGDIDEDGKAENHCCRETTAGECEERSTEDADASLQEPQQRQRQRQRQRQPERKPPEEASERAAAWPAPPPVLLVLHLFLENHRPSSEEGSPPSRRVRFPGGLAYEGRLRRHDEQEQGRREVPHGWGRIVFPDGGFYEGAWRGGVVHGKGALHLANGNCYFGSWVRGRKHGLGTYMYADGSCHEGFYAAGKRSGVGTMHYASGAVYEGEFEAGLRHGVGRLELAPEGASFDGDWVNDMPHGHGVHVDPAGGGERFEGSWRHGIRSGGGTLVQGWAEKGEQEREQEETGGEGVVSSSSDVAWYSGSFSGGYPHGDGMMMHGSMTYCGHVERGVWNGGGRVDLGEPGLGSFEGSWLDGIPRGGGRWQGKQSRLEVDCTFEQGYSGPIRPE